MDVKTEERDRSRDIAAVNAAAWPLREFPTAGREHCAAVPVVIRQSVLNQIHQHGQQHPDVEVCGVLVGHGYRDAVGPYVFVEGSIRGDHAASQAAQVTFTGETRNHIHEVLDRDWPDRRILGWYHTHPGFGIFLSAMDLFSHENLFGAAEQVALVYDPLSGDEGLFVWRSGEATRGEFLVEQDVPEEPPRKPVAGLGGVAPATMAAAGVDQLAGQIKRLGKRQVRLFLTVLVVALLWPIVLDRLTRVGWWPRAANLPSSNFSSKGDHLPGGDQTGSRRLRELKPRGLEPAAPELGRTNEPSRSKEGKVSPSTKDEREGGDHDGPA
jgi:proteasome lid subunit RPN8/RPN11